MQLKMPTTKYARACLIWFELNILYRRLQAKQQQKVEPNKLWFLYVLFSQIQSENYKGIWMHNQKQTKNTNRKTNWLSCK